MTISHCDDKKVCAEIATQIYRARRFISSRAIPAVYFTPEMLLQAWQQEMETDAIRQRLWRAITIDEAHTVIKWNAEPHTAC